MFLGIPDANTSLSRYNGTSDFSGNGALMNYPAVASGFLYLTFDPTAAGTEEDPYLKYDSSGEGVKTVQYLLDSSNWETYKNDYADWVMGSPTFELFVKSYNAYYNSNVTLASAEEYTGKGSLYAAGSVPGGTYLAQYDPNGSICSYHLASPSSYQSEKLGVMFLNYDGSVSRGLLGGLDTRPIVCLDSKVQLIWNSDTSQYDLSW